MTDGRYLPKWAQEEMQRKDRVAQELGRRVEELESMIAGDGGSRFSFGHSTDLDSLRLPTSVRSMNLTLPNGFEMSIIPGGDRNGGVGTIDTVEIMVTSHHGLSIWPQASNVAHLAPRRS